MGVPLTGGLQRSDSDGKGRRQHVVAALMEVAVSLGLVITQVSLGLGHVADD